MFENEVAVNEYLLTFFNKIAADVPVESLFDPAAGHGHPPVWILGHLGIVAEMGQSLLGGTIQRPEWIRRFGPGSSGIVSQDSSLAKDSLIATVNENYRQLRSMASTADQSLVSRPHNVALFTGSPIKTVGHCITVILTNHFGFHLAQLSSCRRTAGFAPLF